MGLIIFFQNLSKACEQKLNFSARFEYKPIVKCSNKAIKLELNMHAFLLILVLPVQMYLSAVRNSSYFFTAANVIKK